MKNIIVFIHRFNDIDHLSPVIFYLSNSNKNIKISIISLWPLKGYERDERVKFLVKQKNVKFFNFSSIHENTFYAKFLEFILGKGTLTGLISLDIKSLFKLNEIKKFVPRFISNLIAYFLFKLNLYHHIINKNYTINWSKFFFEKFKPSLLITDHAISTGPQRELEPIKSILKKGRENNIKIISFPHGVPLFINHPDRYNNVKLNLSSDISDSLILQHQNWLRECRAFGLKDDKVKIFGLLRFFREWEEILHSIITDDLSLKEMGKNKIKVVFMDTGPNNYGNQINEVKKTLEYLIKNKNIFLVYKPHTRNNQINLSLNKNIYYAKKNNSINLIRWSDIIIGSSSSIMIECLFQEKLYISPSYFRKNRMIFEDFKACYEINSLNSFKDFFRDINEKTLNPYDYYSRENVEKFYLDIIYNKKNKDILLQEMIDHILKLSN